MAQVYRRHKKDCPHRSSGRKYDKCHCPVWLAAILGGAKIRKSLGTKDLEEGWHIFLQGKAEGSPLHLPVTPQLITLDQAWEGYLIDTKVRDLSQSTVRKYRLLSRQMKEFALQRGLRFLKQVDLSSLREFQSEWEEGSLTKTKKLERLRAFFHFAQENRWVDENPARKLSWPKYTHRPTLPFSDEEMERILRALAPYVEQTALRGKVNARRLRALVLVLRYSGLRIGDAVKLTTDKIKGNRLLLFTQKTGVQINTVLPDFVVRELDAVPPIRESHFFWEGIGNLDTIVGSWQKRFRKLFRLAGVTDGHAHRFRDTFAARLLEDGTPMESVSILLGHQSVKVTEKYYAPWTADRQRRAEADLRRTWERDPIVLMEMKGTQEVHGKSDTVN